MIHVQKQDEFEQYIKQNQQKKQAKRKQNVGMFKLQAQHKLDEKLTGLQQLQKKEQTQSRDMIRMVRMHPDKYSNEMILNIQLKQVKADHLYQDMKRKYLAEYEQEVAFLEKPLGVSFDY
jgi:hypothetical protein